MTLELPEAVLRVEGIEAVYRVGPAAMYALVSQWVAVIVKLQHQNEEPSARF